jgi:RES domain-containing protein
LLQYLAHVLERLAIAEIPAARLFPARWNSALASILLLASATSTAQ